MKVNYSLVGKASLKQIKDLLKEYGGRCAKVEDGNLQYQISDDKETEAYNALKEKGLVS